MDELIAYCAAKPGAEETYPWGDAELVCKVGGKAFAFIGLDGHTVGLKCGADAEAAAPWRERFPDDITVSGRGVSTDVVEAAARAFLNAVNKVVRVRARGQQDRDVADV